ncbi:MAG: hypothetical protein V4695_04170 [Pseudomonadota bacterium]
MSTNKTNVHTEKSGSQTLPSSPGNDSAVVTPNDNGDTHMPSKNVKKRNVTSDDPDEKQEAQLDDAIELTFPASDPLPAAGGITRIEKPAK